MDITSVSPAKAYKFLGRIFRAGLVPFLHSSPGAGKSSMLRAFAKENDLVYLDIRLSQCDPTDLQGFPVIVDGVATYIPFNLFPIQSTELPEGKNGWLISLDEFSSAPRSVQASSYKIVLDRMVGNHKLHDNVLIAAAGNLATDNAIVNPISTASQSRMVHLKITPSYDDWLQTVAIPHKYDSRIIAYLSQYPNKLMNFDPNHSDMTYACNRTWEFMNSLLSTVNENGESIPVLTDSADLPLYAGTIGVEVASDFLTFCEVFKDLITNEQILADPFNCPLPDKVSAKWAIITRIVGIADANNISNIIVYVKRMELQFRILFFRMMMINNNTLINNPDVAHMAMELSKYVYN